MHPEPGASARRRELGNGRASGAHQEPEGDPQEARRERARQTPERELEHHREQGEGRDLSELPLADGRAGGADQGRDGGHHDLPSGGRRPERGEDHSRREAAEKTVQLRQRMEEGAVREHAGDGLVDAAQPEGEEQPGEDARPCEQGAEGEQQPVRLSSKHGASDPGDRAVR